MYKLNDIRRPIAEDLDLFEKKFRRAMKSPVALLNRITHYIIKRKGKQMRPMFVFFSAKLCGDISDKTHRGAALIELLHTATLVHDDVVDQSYKRRGFFSINALWKNKIAVLVGDYLLSKGLLLAIDNGDFELLQIVSGAVKEMSEGELLQIEKARLLNITEDVYYEVIRQKTASLIKAACATGSASVGADEEMVEMVGNFGENVGMAFQIRDDLFDYGYENVGKPTGIDIKEKKLTLPIIYALNQATSTERKHIMRMIQKHHKNDSKMRDVIHFVEKSGGFEYTREKMNHFQQKALNTLSTFKDNDAARGLEQLIRFTTERSY